MNPATQKTILSIALAATFSFASICPAHAQGGPGGSYDLSAIPVVSAVLVSMAGSKLQEISTGQENGFASIFSNTNPGKMSVTGVATTSTGVSYVIERASDGLKLTVDVLSGGAAKVSAVVGTAVTATVVGSGVVLAASGQALGFIPNALGKALLGSEKVQ